MSNNFNYKEIIDNVGQEIFDIAYNHCVNTAKDDNFKPTYFTEDTPFMPHAWAVAAVAGFLFAIRYPDAE